VNDPVMVLGGATASGKTTLAVELAQRFGAEIVGADSRQIYRGMSIGTAAPTPVERAAVPHHLVEFLDPYERYSAARYAADATAAVLAILHRGKRAIVSGGTGFYIRALSGDVVLGAVHDEMLRERLAAEARIHPPEFLYAWLARVDAARAVALDPNDSYRVVRALEIALSSAQTRMTERVNLRSAGVPFVKLFLDPSLDVLDRRIEHRTGDMLNAGLVEEAERIGKCAVAASAVGYPQALAYLRGWSTREEMRSQLARATRRYARRQRSWFRREPGMTAIQRDESAHAARELLGWS
jgi:tRNA dimethylallyltransferase